MSDYLNSLVNLSVSRTSQTAPRAGFGVALVLAYHALNADRVRSYSDLQGVISDGFTPYDTAYHRIAAALAQEPAPTKVKLARRALPFTQVIDLTPAGPSAGDVYTAEIDGHAATYTADGTPTLAEVCTGLAAAVNAFADVDAIVATGASATDTQTLTGTTLDGVAGNGSMIPPRFITFTFSSHADWDATSITMTGLDGNGNAQTESIAIPNGGNTTVTSTKRYLRVTSIAVPAQSGTGGTFTVGVRALVTAVSSGTKVTCTSVAGELHSYALATSNIALEDKTTDPGIATDLAAVLVADPDWYTLLLDSNGQAEVTAAAAWVESNKRTFGFQTSDTAHLSSGSVTCLGYTLKAAGYTRSFGIVKRKLHTSDAMGAAAWVGEELPKDPGASAWGYKRLAGVAPDTLTDSQRAAVEGYGLNHHLLVGTVGITNPGKTSSGEWIDVVRDIDWFEANLQADILDALLSNDKLPFTDGGIAVIASVIGARLDAGVTAGVFAASPKPTVTVPSAAAVSSADRSARTLTGVTFSARLAGSIHNLTLRGRVSV